MKIRSKKPKLPGTIITASAGVFIFHFKDLSKTIQNEVIELIPKGSNISREKDGLLIKINGRNHCHFQSELGRLFSKYKIKTNNREKPQIGIVSKKYYKKINFDEINWKAQLFAKKIKDNTEDIAVALQDFETYNVVLDEISRSIDHLTNLNKNKDYFEYCIGGVTTFLPLNQPLYATVCFGIVPSLMAEGVVIRPPTATQKHYKRLERVLNFSNSFSNLRIFYGLKEEFARERVGKTEVVIFTGTEENGYLVYKQFRPKLFIFNGAGHNPIVVTPNANIEKAMDSTLRVALQNQGQDCAAPNSILVHKSVLPQFRSLLLDKLKEIYKLVGTYKNRKNIIGPNTEIKHLTKICEMFTELRAYCIKGGNIDTKNGIIYPTVFEIPLAKKAMLSEFFAPVIVLQPYEEDSQLKLYFDHPQYYPHAMYVTVFGNSDYVKSLIGKSLHTKKSILYDTDLHIEERGFMPYGGLGPAASCVYINGKKIPGATLPQRDIYEYLVKSSRDYYMSRG